MAEKTPKVDENNFDKDGGYVGTEEAPQVATVNASPDPNPHGEATSHRHAERQGGKQPSTTDADGNRLTWTDPDAVPGTVGDDPEETIRAVAAAGGAAVKVDPKK